jgi:hypothetical protein
MPLRPFLTAHKVLYGETFFGNIYHKWKPSRGVVGAADNVDKYPIPFSHTTLSCSLVNYLLFSILFLPPLELFKLSLTRILM